MLYLTGIVITIFLVILLTGKKNKTRADRILIVWLCVIAFHLVLFYLFITGKIYNYPVLMGHLPYPLLHGPLLFLYTAELTGQRGKNRIAWPLHFIPVIILYLFLIPFFSLSPAEKINVYRHKGAGYEGLIQVCFVATVISGIAYIAASLFLLRRYKKSIKNEFSNIEKINLAWLRYLIYGLAVIWIAIIFGSDPVVFGIAVVFVFFLGYFGIRQVGIFTTAHPRTDKLQTFPLTPIAKDSNIPIYPEQSQYATAMQLEINAIASKVKYEKSGLGEQQAGRIYEQLVTCMSDQKLFSDSELTLAALANALDVHPNHLSQVINSYEGKSFYDYINFHRVEEFKRLAPLPGNRNYTLLSLAFECGFNSKTSFNRNFKKATGVSPSEYIQQLNISLK